MLFVVHEPIETDRSFSSQVVNGQITRDRVEPGREFVFAVVLTSALENTNPRFLEEILGKVTISCETYQVPEQAMLILLDQMVQQVGIAPAKTVSYGARLGLHTHHEVVQCGDHATGYTGEGTGKMQNVRRLRGDRKLLSPEEMLRVSRKDFAPSNRVDAQRMVDGRRPA